MSVDDSMRRTIAEQHDEIGALKAENAKLRELCKNMWRGAMRCMDYAECLSFAGDLVDKMRELRVEVDG